VSWEDSRIGEVVEVLLSRRRVCGADEHVCHSIVVQNLLYESESEWVGKMSEIPTHSDAEPFAVIVEGETEISEAAKWDLVPRRDLIGPQLLPAGQQRTCAILFALL
jgi:hypothetical protein